MTQLVLVVCSANVCRSPMIALLLERAVGDTGSADIRVLSAGHQAAPGRPACPALVRWAGAHDDGGRTARHRSRLLDPALVAAADLVLTADRRDRAAVTRLVPSAVERTFTLREAALLGRLLPAGARSVPVPDLAAGLNAVRGLTDLPEVTTLRPATAPWRAVRVHEHDLPDPHQDVPFPHRLLRRLALPAVDSVAGLLTRHRAAQV